MSAGAPAFCDRNGFALQADLEDPKLETLLQLCLQENEEFTGERGLDWSRQWEYPWVLANLPVDGGGRRVLDAGSGYRFFTPLLAARGFEVDACDLDPSIGPRLDEVAARADLSIEFTTQDLTRLSYPDDCFDYVCCISVLEHTADPEQVVMEFQRCLAPGGILLLTFDVSVAGDRDISVDRARSLIEKWHHLFEPVHPFCGDQWLDPRTLGAATEPLRTSWFRRHRPDALPWRFVSRTFVRGLRRGRLRRPFFDLAVIGLALRKKGGA